MELAQTMVKGTRIIKRDKEVVMTRVIRDTRDASLDYCIPLDRAKELFNEGKLAYDVTNGAYCHKRKGEFDSRMK